MTRSYLKTDPRVQTILETVYHAGVLELAAVRGYDDAEAEEIWRDIVNGLPQESSDWGQTIVAAVDAKIDGLIWKAPWNYYGEPVWHHECAVHRLNPA